MDDLTAHFAASHISDAKLRKEGLLAPAAKQVSPEIVEAARKAQEAYPEVWVNVRESANEKVSEILSLLEANRAEALRKAKTSLQGPSPIALSDRAAQYTRTIQDLNQEAVDSVHHGIIKRGLSGSMEFCAATRSSSLVIDDAGDFIELETLIVALSVLDLISFKVQVVEVERIPSMQYVLDVLKLKCIIEGVQQRSSHASQARQIALYCASILYNKLDFEPVAEENKSWLLANEGPYTISKVFWTREKTIIILDTEKWNYIKGVLDKLKEES